MEWDVIGQYKTGKHSITLHRIDNIRPSTPEVIKSKYHISVWSHDRISVSYFGSWPKHLKATDLEPVDQQTTSQ